MKSPKGKPRAKRVKYYRRPPTVAPEHMPTPDEVANNAPSFDGLEPVERGAKLYAYFVERLFANARTEEATTVAITKDGITRINILKESTEELRFTKWESHLQAGALWDFCFWEAHRTEGACTSADRRDQLEAALRMGGASALKPLMDKGARVL